MDGLAQEESLGVWHENWHAVEVAARSMTQWNVSMSGVVGLRYEALPLVMRALGVPRAAWPEVFAGIQVIEAECLKLLRK